ncbi:hypothetical protein LOK49_LG06G02588 [Camellia lanceoleosa]|uniref:Uncharacterized protein n=1 Tax=Camellia lanceoleosa TaxID=1840588 RepID=A0ACC0HAN4_9ERIC|nr:hypothetical protein LOK49_LG06G02588 [Camellia lanceoleosa]
MHMPEPVSVKTSRAKTEGAFLIVKAFGTTKEHARYEATTASAERPTTFNNVEQTHNLHEIKTSITVPVEHVEQVSIVHFGESLVCHEPQEFMDLDFASLSLSSALKNSCAHLGSFVRLSLVS